jgi:uncharacterized protein YecT (DUF1311 family)
MKIAVTNKFIGLSKKMHEVCMPTFNFHFLPTLKPTRNVVLWIIPFFAFGLSVEAVAAPDETIIQEMAKQTHLPANDIRRDYDACDSGVTLSMKICGNYRLMVEDARLNKIYKSTLAEARKWGYESSIVQAERAWITYRDAMCAYEGQMGAGGGTAEGLYVLSCKEDLTKQQADRLEKSTRG